MRKIHSFKTIASIFLISLFLFTGCSQDPFETSSKSSTKSSNESYTLENIPQYSDSPYVVLEDNMPSFEEADKTTTSFEEYSELDVLGRCGVTFANIGIDLMPTQERGKIGQVKPSGWQTIKYDNVDGKFLYNRCHLIGYQLAAENANVQNLITGTRYLNIEGMLPFENLVTNYIKETKNHVLYRVTPIFEGLNLVASGVQMEGFSVEDDGEGICFNVYAYNAQPGIMIDYANGDSNIQDGEVANKSNTTTPNIDNPNTTTPTPTQGSTAEQSVVVRANSNSMIYHCPGQGSYEKMAESQYLILFDSEQEAQEAGYRKAKR